MLRPLVPPAAPTVRPLRSLRVRRAWLRSERVGALMLLSGLGLASGGCTLLLGEIPADDWQPPDAQAGRDGGDDLDGSPFDAGDPSEWEGDANSGDGDQPPLDAGLVDDELDASLGDGDADGGDSSVAPLEDGGEPEGPDASDVRDAGQDAAIPCTKYTWYADDDGDGEGNSAKTTSACEKPAGKWVNRGGDCSDKDARAHHGQTTYYGTPYTNAAGKDSFDFDCSGQEEPWAGQPHAAATCDPFNCTASGYAKTARTGTGVYAHCGSLTVTTCKFTLLICGPSNAATTSPFLCR
jgi:hypothetical protein